MDYWDIRVIAGSYTAEEGKVVIDLFGRTQAGESITARIRDFLPYFYLVEPRQSILEELEKDSEVLKLKEVDLDVAGEQRKCVKVTIQFPFKVPEYRNRYKINTIVLAADIPFIHRFYYDYNLPSCIRIHGTIINKKSKQLPKTSKEIKLRGESVTTNNVEIREHPISVANELTKIENRYTTDLVVEVKKIEPIEAFKPQLRILSFDIENSIKEGTIFCICCAFRNTKGKLKYRSFTGEEGDIILKFVEFIHEFDPDVITGYNIDNYDIPVVLERAEKNKLGMLLVGRDLGKFYKVGNARFWRIHGRVIADAWWNAKKELRPKKETLNFLSQMLFDEKKADVDPSKIDEEWANNSKKVIKYCERDAELALRILEKISVLDKAMDLGAVAKLPLDDAINSGTSTLIDSILIREADKNAIGVPCTKRVAKTAKIEGGYVHTLKSGLYNWVCLLDFKSMYPSIIIANNICFTTLNGSGTIKSPTGVRFLNSEQRKGILPKILEEFMTDRERVKKMMNAESDPEKQRYYNGLQDAIKILMNSVYGVFASDFYRFTDQKIGASITAFARKNIKDVIRKLESEKNSVIYSDTDSIFLETQSEDLKGAIKIGKSISKRFSKGGRVLEFEGIFEPFFTHGKKKRYVGQKLYPEETMVIRGYETRRTDSFDLQSEALTKMFKLVLSGQNEELISYARKTISEVQAGKIPMEKLVISKTVKDESKYKDPNRMANVIAMRKLRDLGYDVVPGMKVSYIVTNGHHVPQEVEPFIDDRPVTFKPDLEYYAERMALTLSRITEGLDPETDWDSKALLTGSQQKSLFSDTFSKKPEIEVEPDPEPESESESESLPEDQTTSDEDLKRESTGSASVKGLSSGKKRKKKRPEKPKGGTNLEDFL